MKTYPNHPAYPISEEETDRIDQGVQIYSGLTKREHFAAMAMQGLLSNPEWMKIFEGEKYLMESEIVADTAIAMADNLIAALNKEETE